MSGRHQSGVPHAPSTIDNTEWMWRPFRRWCEEHNLHPEPPSTLTLAAYLHQRAQGDWPEARPPMKYSSLTAARKGILRKWEMLGYDVEDIRGDDRIRNLLGNARLRLPADQVVMTGSRALTNAELLLLLEFLDNVAAEGPAAALWAARWKAYVLTGIAFGLRASELAQLQKDWIQVESTHLLAVTIPSGKGRTEPASVSVVPDGSSFCPAVALGNWLNVAAQVGYSGDAIFPRVAPPAPPPYPEAPPSVAGLTLADFPHLIRELVTADIIPADLPAGSTRRLQWRCVRGHEWTTAVQHRTGRNTTCKRCKWYLVPWTDKAGQHLLVLDTIGDRVADPDFHPTRPDDFRLYEAVRRQRQRDGLEFKRICADAGIEGERGLQTVTSHAIRKTTGTALAAAGYSMAALSRHLRHTNMTMSQVYIDDRIFRAEPLTLQIPGW